MQRNELIAVFRAYSQILDFDDAIQYLLSGNPDCTTNTCITHIANDMIQPFFDEVEEYCVKTESADFETIKDDIIRAIEAEDYDRAVSIYNHCTFAYDC